jgi:hypothetical protein
MARWGGVDDQPVAAERHQCFRRGDVIGGCLDKFGLVGLLFY